MSSTRDNPGMHPDQQAIQAFLHHLTNIGRSPNTVKAYRCALRGASGDRDRMPAGLCAVPDEIEAWLAKFPDAKTRASYASALSSFYRWAVRRGYMQLNPMVDMDLPRAPQGIPRPITDAELATILTGARSPIREWSCLAAYAGARCIEISRLDRRDITVEVVYLHGKGNKRRVVPTHPELWAVVPRFPGGLVAGGRVAHAISQSMNREYRCLGLHGVTAHRLRHYFGTWAHAASGDVRVTQELMGHASPATTAVYAQVTSTAMRAAVLGIRAVAGVGTVPAVATA